MNYSTKQEYPYSITIYLLGWNHGLEVYQVIQELYPFYFLTDKQREEFYSDLPNLSALDLMQLLEPNTNDGYDIKDFI